MGDYTYMRITIVDPGPDPGKVEDLLHEYGFTYDDFAERWTQEEGRCGTLSDVADALGQLGAWFDGHEDPKYEWMGTYIAHTPALGHYAGECDSEGSVMKTHSAVRSAALGKNASVAIDELFGRPWGKALDKRTQEIRAAAAAATP